MVYRSIPSDVGHRPLRFIKLDHLSRNDPQSGQRTVPFMTALVGLLARFKERLHAQANPQVRPLPIFEILSQRIVVPLPLQNFHGAVVGAHSREDDDVGLGYLGGRRDVDDGVAARGYGVADRSDIAGAVVQEGND